MNGSELKGERIEVAGIVQGVGFRPFVHNLARRHRLDGYVLNSSEGVVIEVEGAPGNIECFVHDLTRSAPPLSRIDMVSRTELEPFVSYGKSVKRFHGFDIRESLQGGRPTALIPPDICICRECLDELFDPLNRRYLYPFINCTNCGPRFTIIRGLPYDRPNTTMASFAMCLKCRREYDDPGDRRFHAQPNACRVCGPHVSILDGYGNPMEGDPVLTAVSLLKQGRIVAVKGIGGFHLAVDGTDNEAVRRLRSRKRREEKPLALMTASIGAAQRFIHFGSREEEILESIERPIFLALKRSDTLAADSVAPGNSRLGVMLPYTPLHYLLFYYPDAGGDFHGNIPVFPALVMTSGNLSEEPICKDNCEALERLTGIADAFLVHNRDIHVRSDDSVVRIVLDKPSYIRRSRGYVPVPVTAKPTHSQNKDISPVLALGAELKNTICITTGSNAFPSQHIGDLENVQTLEFFHEAVSHFKSILDLEPWIFAYDLHPEYLSTKYFKHSAEHINPECYASVGVQHHHAHIASVMAEHGFEGPVIGFAMDGTGYGLDGTVWGGEILLCTPWSFSRAARLSTLRMPGGESAVREPWRMACSYLWSRGGDDWRNLELPCLRQISRDELDMLFRVWEGVVNSPKTTSLGRLFDAVASILDIRHVSRFEGQAAMMLEIAASAAGNGVCLPYAIQPSEPERFIGYPVLGGNFKSKQLPQQPHIPESFILDYRPTVDALVEGFRAGRHVSALAMDFHETLLASFVDVLDRVSGMTGIRDVALSGGCWQNSILSGRFPEMLACKGYRVLTNHRVPVNDGGISLGQAYVAMHCAALE